MKPVSVLLWELDEKDIRTLPDGFPVLRYDTLTESVTALYAGVTRALKDKRYVYLLYKIPFAFPASGEKGGDVAADQASEDPRLRGAGV